MELPTLSINELITYSSIIGMALVPIYWGSLKSVEDRLISKSSKKNADGGDSYELEKREAISQSDAWMFPVIGSVTLFSLYLLFRFIAKEYINLLFTLYFMIFGIGAVSTTISGLIESWFVGVLTKKQREKRSFHISFRPFWSKEKFEVFLTYIDIGAIIIAVSISVWYVFTKHWIANNIFGLCFCIQGIAMLSIGSYKVGCILLSGLFFYDIFWVFGTDVMVSVAKSFDAPIKLLWPRNLFAEQYQFSLLGLGDIVIPGIFIALLLRFDFKLGGNRRNFAKPYFHICFISYILGLVTTMAVMHIFRAAQPALLYLVPFCILSSLFTAIGRGELRALLDYTEEAPPSAPEATAGTNTNTSNANATKKDN